MRWPFCLYDIFAAAFFTFRLYLFRMPLYDYIKIYSTIITKIIINRHFKYLLFLNYTSIKLPATALIKLFPYSFLNNLVANLPVQCIDITFST